MKENQSTLELVPSLLVGDLEGRGLVGGQLPFTFVPIVDGYKKENCIETQS